MNRTLSSPAICAGEGGRRPDEGGTPAKAEGWKHLFNARKWHYFREGRSLCGKWLNLGSSGFETGNDQSPDNCSGCRLRLLSEELNAPQLARTE